MARKAQTTFPPAPQHAGSLTVTFPRFSEIGEWHLAAVLLVIVLLANGSAMWGLWFRHREDDAVRLPDRPGESRGSDLAP